MEIGEDMLKNPYSNLI